jgi:hypothetical protein
MNRTMTKEENGRISWAPEIEVVVYLVADVSGWSPLISNSGTYPIQSYTITPNFSFTIRQFDL